MIIEEVHPNSIAAELDWQPGDRVISINGQEIYDIIDFRFQTAEEYVEVLLRTGNGTDLVYQIEKEYHEELGVSFAGITNDGIRQCHNRCLFCFVDQMPHSLRSSLYVKDDDYRYSFLQGTFVTLTNVKKKDLRRIAQLKLSPLYISVHTINPDLRAKMLRNKQAAQIMDQLRYLARHDIEIHAQIVLCAGLNDGQELQKSILELSELWPAVQSLAVVPVGLTGYRRGLAEIEPINQDKAQETIDLVTRYQELFLHRLGTRLVYLADEFYLLTGKDIPREEDYEGFPQLENGVGIVRLFLDNFAESLKRINKPLEISERYLLVTGVAAAPVLEKSLNELNKKIKGFPIEMAVVENRFFGGLVTVTGLLSASDIIKQLKNCLLENQFSTVLLPDILLNESGLTIDDYTTEQLEQQLGIKIVILPSSGSGLPDYLLRCN